ncbi:osteopontin isoform X2 [Pseudoliparis swirei]|uniref:osteopontin isoform X2 n=1 Tax=Pseudoliparis swirei TaxID=2059687 RepID=UPI0024BDD570|nr:osteopontin isoform X2 [Pseudoliparis swirei]
MKAAVVFVLLFATVLCRPAKKVAGSSSESSEEVMRRPAAQPLSITEAEVPVETAAASSSDESAGSDEDELAPEVLGALKSASTDTTASPPATASVSPDAQDSDDDDDDDDEDDSEESDESSESGESSSTAAPTTVDPAVVTEEPFAETTAEPIVPTIVTDTETARGDGLAGYPSDYKSMNYLEEKSYHKGSAPYKSYEYMGKKMAYDMTEGNEVEKSPKVYKALQIHNNILEEDTSTPEVEIQGLDISSQDLRQASNPEEAKQVEEESATTGAPEEEEVEEEEKQSDSSASTSQESEDEDSQSSEEATATPGAADSESDESPEADSDEEAAAPDATTDIPVFITAK